MNTYGTLCADFGGKLSYIDPMVSHMTMGIVALAITQRLGKIISNPDHFTFFGIQTVRVFSVRTALSAYLRYLKKQIKIHEVKIGNFVSIVIE